MKTLLIGGAGYLGIPLVNNLLDCDVTVYDKFIYSNETFLKPNTKIIKDDVNNIEMYGDLLNSQDLIIYLASPRLNELKTESQLNEPIIQLKKTLNLITNPHVRFIFISSCSVYGKTNEIVNEDSEISSTSLYSHLKITSEYIVLKKNNPNFKILRLSTLYGFSRLNRNDVLINDLVNKIKNNENIEIYEPKSVRPHLHVKDCVKVIKHIIFNDFDGNILNIGKNEFNISKKEILDIVKTKYGDFKYDVVKQDDDRHYRVNFNKLKEFYDFEPISFEDGIGELIEKKQIVCGLEDWDTIFNYYRPNVSSKSWYLKETNTFDIPKTWATWSMFDIENNNKLWPDDIIRNTITPFYTDDDIIYLEKDKINTEHLYIIDVFDNTFFQKNKDIGFKCISKEYIENVRECICKIVIILQYEGYSGMNNNNQDLEIIGSWMDELELPCDSVHYISGNLLIDDVRKQRGLEFKCHPISVFDSWVEHQYLGDEIIEFKPTNDKYLFLTYNRNPRNHRIKLVQELINSDLFNLGKISLGKFNDYQHQELSKLTPIEIDRTLDINWAVNINLPDYESTFISIVTETLIEESVLFLSEKIFKPIIVGQPFIILGNQYTLKYLKNLGYKTFDKWIDESYDDEENVDKRISMIVNEILKFKDKTIEELSQIRDEMIPICVYNKVKHNELIKTKYFDENGFMDNRRPILEILKKIYKEI